MNRALNSFEKSTVKVYCDIHVVWMNIDITKIKKNGHRITH